MAHDRLISGNTVNAATSVPEYSDYLDIFC